MARALFSRSVHDFWGLFLVEGISMLVLGTVAILLPPFLGIAVAILLGWLLLASGFFGILMTVSNHHAPGFWWSLLSAALTTMVGVVLFSWPAGGTPSLSLALAGFLAFDGVLAIGMAYEHQRRLTPKWQWLLANGLADLLFAWIILVWLPQSAEWTLGFFIGTDMIIGGATLLAMALDSRKIRGLRHA